MSQIDDRDHVARLEVGKIVCSRITIEFFIDFVVILHLLCIKSRMPVATPRLGFECVPVGSATMFTMGKFNL